MPVPFAGPHCASTAAITAGGDGSFLLAGSASTSMQADKERFRPLTHQLSLKRIPDIISGEVVVVGINSPELSRVKVNGDGMERERPANAAGNRRIAWRRARPHPLPAIRARWKSAAPGECPPAWAIQK